MTFESHWASEHFEPYDPDVNGEELERALREFDRRSLGEASTISFAAWTCGRTHTSSECSTR